MNIISVPLHSYRDRNQNICTSTKFTNLYNTIISCAKTFNFFNLIFDTLQFHKTGARTTQWTDIYVLNLSKVYLQDLNFHSCAGSKTCSRFFVALHRHTAKAEASPIHQNSEHWAKSESETFIADYVRLLSNLIAATCSLAPSTAIKLISYLINWKETEGAPLHHIITESCQHNITTTHLLREERSHD